MSRKAMQMALEALEQYKGVVVTHHDPESFRRMEVDGGQAARDAIAALRAALAEPDSDYERGFVDGMNLQTKGSVDKAVNRIAEPEQEPVAYCTLEQLAALKLTVPSSDKIALFTAPTPRKPLSEGEIYAAIQGIDSLRAVEVARAIERAHGIGEQHEH